MNFCSEADCEKFFHSVPEFEKMLVRSGIVLIKYWFSITDDEQQFRFMMRIQDPLKQWKLSPMDVESRRRWEQNCINHLLSQIPYQEVHHEPVVLPARVHNPNYTRGPILSEMYVPSVY